MKKKLDRTAVGSEALKSACHRESRTHLQDKKFNTEGNEKHTGWQHCGLTCTKQAEQTGLLAKSKASEEKQSIKYASIFLMVEGSTVTCKTCKMEHVAAKSQEGTAYVLCAQCGERASQNQ